MCLPEDIVSFGGSVAVVVEEERSEKWRPICRLTVAVSPLARPALVHFGRLIALSLSKVDMGNDIFYMHMFSAIDIAVELCPKSICHMSFHAYPRRVASKTFRSLLAFMKSTSQLAQTKYQ